MLPETDLWVVAPANQSAWFARLDWYLNWQMCKGLAHRPTRPSPEIERLASEYEIPIPYAAQGQPGPLLIASRGLVPADKCAVLPMREDLAGWLGRIARLAQELGAKSARIFLPAGQSRADAQAAWSRLKAAELTVEFAEDTEVFP